MAWGGGFGPMGGGPGGQWNRGGNEGLPFAGVPPELHKMVAKLEAKEPPAGLAEVDFSHVQPPAAPFSLLRLLRPKMGALLIVLVIVAFETAMQQIGPRLTQIGIDEGVLKGDFDVIWAMVAIYLGSLVFSMLLSGLRTLLSGRIGEDVLYRLRVRIFTHIQRLSLDYFTEEKAGRIMTRVTSDVEALQQLFQQGLVSMAMQVMTLLFVVTQLFSMNVALACWVTFGVLPLLVLLTLWYRSASDYGFTAVRDWVATVLADLQENLSGIRVVTAHNRQRHNNEKHRRIVGSYRAANLYTAHLAGVFGPGAQLLGVVAQALVLFVGGRMVLSGDLSIGELFAFLLYLNAFFAPIQALVQLYTVYQQGRAAVGKLRDLFATEPSVKEKPDAAELPPIEGAVTLEGVTFGYKPGVPVISGVDLSIAAGETFALVGPTGAGKSTIAKLVTRFYDPQEGRILIDGHDVRDVSFRSLRRQLGVVPQEAFLFAGTIGDNIRFAQPDASDEDVREACRVVGILDLIDGLPQGLDTPCHERGVTLSSGERQLIALARAFLASPRVLVLDEATSSLDLSTEAMVERALDVLLEGRTAILIAHRLNTAMRADRIGVVADGGLVEVGSHDELLAKGGRYAQMFETWRASVTA